MAKIFQAVRGMNDVLPVDSAHWFALEQVLRKVVCSYGYSEIRFPIVEFTELFTRTIGEVTDIVEKEMYAFVDRNGDHLALRPEGTAGCVRAGVEHGLLYNQIQRLFYLGPMFRHERPQKGRYRQFHQFGVEVFGLAGPDIDVEILLMAARFWEELQLSDVVELQINTLGTLAVREKYRAKLVAYFQANYDVLDVDSKHRLETNPLRILDSKNPEIQAVLVGAPKILDCLDLESEQHFVAMCNLLDEVGLRYVVNPRLVRGLDYYCHTVFEWVATSLGSQSAICAGGHYDNLVAELGGKSTPAIGFGIGLERLVSLVSPDILRQPMYTVYLVLLGSVAQTYGMKLAEYLRRKFKKLDIIVNCGDGNLKSQLKRADKSGAVLAFIIGEAELAAEVVSIKHLRNETAQQQIKVAEMDGFLQNYLEIMGN